MTFHPDDLPDLSGKNYIITGATSGIGFYTAARLAEHGAHVYICARNETKGREAIDGIKALYSNAHLDVLIMDHTSLATVVTAAKLFLSKETALHGLVNNAGVIAMAYELTADGYDIQWQTNHLAHWVFTSHLLPMMLQTSKGLPLGSVRIVNVTSGGHMMAPKTGINFTDTSMPKESSIARYGQSKLANILHAKILNKQYGPGSERAKIGQGEIWTSSVHPGVVHTNLDSRASEMPIFMKAATFVINAVGSKWPPDKGAWTNVFCVASPKMKAEESGLYFERIAKSTGTMSSAKSKDPQLAEALEEWTNKEMKSKGFV